MDAIEIVRGLFAHMEWADAAVWRSVLACDGARSDAGIRERLFHIHLVQRAFLSIWREAQPGLRTGESMEMNELLRWGRDYHSELPRFLATVTPDVLDRTMPVPWAARAAERLGRPSLSTPTVGETMLQVVSHSTYHRAQVNLRLRELGGEPPLTDFIAWTWFGKPAAEWPAETS